MHDGEPEPMHGPFGPIEAGIEVQRTIKRAAMTTFWMALRGLSAQATTYTDNMGILSELRRGDKKCISPNAKEADVWIFKNCSPCMKAAGVK